MNALIQMPVDEARRLKWQRGREEHGDVMVADPLEELFQEMLDASNYIPTLQADSGLDVGDKAVLASISRQVLAAAEEIRRIRLKHPDRQYVPTIHPFK